MKNTILISVVLSVIAVFTSAFAIGYAVGVREKKEVVPSQEAIVMWNTIDNCFQHGHQPWINLVKGSNGNALFVIKC